MPKRATWSRLALPLLLASLAAVPAAAQEHRRVSLRPARTARSIAAPQRSQVRPILPSIQHRRSARSYTRTSACSAPSVRPRARRIIRRPQPVSRIWVQGYWQRQWQDPVYRWHTEPCWRRVQVLVRAGAWVKVWVPGYWHYA